MKPKSFQKKLIKCISPFIAQSILIIFTSYRILPSDNNIGINTFCLNENITKLDKSICSNDLKFDKVVIIYNDGMPYYVARIQNEFYKEEMIEYSIENPGIPDSGPVYRNFITGRLNYFYTGSLEFIDNIITQMKNSGINILGNAIGYPIRTMTDEKVFSTLYESHNGIEYLSDDYRVTSDSWHFKKPLEEVGPIWSSDSREDVIKNIKRYMNHVFNNKIKHDEVKKTMDYHFRQEDRSWFCYNGDTDGVAHNFSVRGAETQYCYGQQQANIHSLYEDYIKKGNDDILVVLMSDHGTYDYPYEVELTTHGKQDELNRAFAFFLSPRFKKHKLTKPKNQNVSAFAGTFCLFIKNCNIPLLSTHRPLPKFQDDPNEVLIALRSREIQQLRYVDGNYNRTLDQNSFFIQNFDPNNSLQEVSNQSKTKLNKTLHEYSNYITNLENEYTQYDNILRVWDLLKMAVISIPFIIIALRWIIPRLFSSEKHSHTVDGLQYYPLKISLLIFTTLVFIWLIVYFPIEDDAKIPSIFFICFLIIIQATKYMKNKHSHLYAKGDSFYLDQSLSISQIASLAFLFGKIMSHVPLLFLDFKNTFLNIVTTAIAILILFYYVFQAIIEELKNPVFQKKYIEYTIIALISYNYIMVFVEMIRYEIAITKKGNIEPDLFMNSIAVQYFNYIKRIFLQSFFINEYSSHILFLANITSMLYWFSNSYFRFAVFLGVIVPFELLFINSSKYNENIYISDKRKNMFYSMWFNLIAVFMYYTFEGSSETTVNVRAANRSHCIHMGVFHLESGLIFAVTKNTQYIITLVFYNFRIKQYLQNRNLFDKSFKEVLDICYKNLCIENLVMVGLLMILFQWSMVLQVERELKGHQLALTWYSMLIITDFQPILLFLIKYTIIRLIQKISPNIILQASKSNIDKYPEEINIKKLEMQVDIQE